MLVLQRPSSPRLALAIDCVDFWRWLLETIHPPTTTVSKRLSCLLKSARHIISYRACADCVLASSPLDYPRSSARRRIRPQDLRETCKALSSRPRLYELEIVPCDGDCSATLTETMRVRLLFREGCVWPGEVVKRSHDSAAAKWNLTLKTFLSLL